MPELIAKSSLDGREITLGDVTLAEVDVWPITAIALFPGGGKSVAKALKPLKLSMPGPNEMRQSAAARLIWTGRDQAFLLGIAAPDLPGAALTDQSGGWACLALSGPQAVDVLARLVPLDLRLQSFAVGQCLRAPLNHISAIVMRLGEDRFEVMVFRSMARTAWHELQEAMSAVLARKSLRS